MKRKPAAKKTAPRRATAPKRKAVKAIPDGFHAVTPYLSLRNAGEALAFYKRAFGARELMRMEMPGSGKIGHAEMKIGDSIVMMADEFPEMDFLGPKSRGGTSVTLHLYVRDCDRVFETAVAAGARVVRPLKDEFYGDRTGTIEDPFGHIWSVSTHKEELTQAQVRRRMEESMKQGGG